MEDDETIPVESRPGAKVIASGHPGEEGGDSYDGPKPHYINYSPSSPLHDLKGMVSCPKQLTAKLDCGRTCVVGEDGVEHCEHLDDLPSQHASLEKRGQSTHSFSVSKEGTDPRDPPTQDNSDEYTIEELQTDSNAQIPTQDGDQFPQAYGFQSTDCEDATVIGRDYNPDNRVPGEYQVEHLPDQTFLAQFFSDVARGLLFDGTPSATPPVHPRFFATVVDDGNFLSGEGPVGSG